MNEKQTFMDTFKAHIDECATCNSGTESETPDCFIAKMLFEYALIEVMAGMGAEEVTMPSA